MIITLQPNQIFVFGSNLQGHHSGGAAAQALKDFGAIWGVGVGLQGKSYAIPTMPPLTLIEIEQYIIQFVHFARFTPQYEYLVTPIGTGIAGYSTAEMGEIWSKLSLPSNIKLL